MKKLLISATITSTLLFSTPASHAVDIDSDIPYTNSTYDNMTAGTVNIFEGRILNRMSAGHIDTMTGTSNINSINGGTITSVEGFGHINFFLSGSIDTLKDNASINTMYGGYIGELKGRSNINFFSRGGTISTISESAFINYLDISATINNMIGGRVYSIIGGTIQNMAGGYVGDFTEGVIDNASGGTINKVNYSATINNLSGTTNINNMLGGNIQSMTGGTIVNMNNNAFITNMDNGYIAQINGNASIETMNGGIINIIDGANSFVGNLTDGTIGTIQGTSYISTMTGGLVDNLAGEARILELNGGQVNIMHSGEIVDIGVNGEIGEIIYGTLTGNVNFQTGASYELNVNNYGLLNLHAEDTTKAFDRIVNTGVGTVVDVLDYQFGTNSEINMGDSSLLIVNSVDMNKVTFGNNGAFSFHYFGGTYNHASINEFSATESVLFEFYVNPEIGGENDKLTITNISAGSELSHQIVAAGYNLTDEYREPIDLIEDLTNSLDFSLITGDYIGIGAKNYTLGKNGNWWSLFLKRDSLSDQAKNIGTVAGSLLNTVYSVSNSLHERTGSVDYYNISKRTGSWARTYSNKTSFKDLASTDIQNYGIEGGFDKQLIIGCSGRMIGGIGAGINYTTQHMNNQYSKDGRSKSTTPYVMLYNTIYWYNGLYIDMVAKYAYSNVNSHYYDGANIRNDFKTNHHIGTVSIETGYNFPITKRLFVEPRAQLSYAYIEGDKFTDDSNFRGKYQDTQSILSEVGILLKYDLHAFEPYIKLGYLHEFDGKTNITYDNTKYYHDLEGGKFEAGIGFLKKFNTSKFDFYGETVYQIGQNAYRNYNLNLGMRYNF